MSGNTSGSPGNLPLWIGYTSAAVLIFTLGLWSTRAEIAGAVVASGHVEVTLERQVVQHPEGGVVGAILVGNGDHVAAGDVLVRFDDTFLRSQLSIIERQLLEVSARQARLAAEQTGSETMAIAAVATDFDLDPLWVGEQFQSQQDLFEARYVSLLKAQDQLVEQQAAVTSKIDGLEAQNSAIGRQRMLIDRDIRDQNDLMNRGLAVASNLRSLQREAARLEGETGRLTAAIAEAEIEISQIKIQILQLSDQRREAALAELTDLSFFRIEQEEKRLELLEKLQRLDVRAPVSGTVFNSQVTTLRSVVEAAQPILHLVPGELGFLISARIDPLDVDQVVPGQSAMVRFPSFETRTTPDISAAVVRVSADVVTDNETGHGYYEAVLAPSADDVAAIPDLALRPGMPVEAFLSTSLRTPLSYLTQPLTTYFNRAFRES